MRRHLGSLIALAMLAGGCTSQTAAPSGGSLAPPPGRSPASIPVATPAASPASLPTPVPTIAASPTTTPRTSPPPRPSPSASDRGGHGGAVDSRPPDGYFSAAGADGVVAYLGSYCYGYVCADSPLPTTRVTPRLKLPAGTDHLVFRLKGSHAFSSWSVAVWAARDERGRRRERLASGGGDGDAIQEASFQPPGSGDWILDVFVRYAEGGDASYSVRLIVP